MFSDGHVNGGDWAGMVVWMSFLVILLLVAIWAIARWTTAAGAQGPTLAGGDRQPTARETLDVGLARGDITLDEYDKRRAAIERTTTPERRSE